MKYSFELLINRPRAEVWNVFNEPANLKKWQPSIVRVELMEGTTGQPGAVSILTFKSGEREFSLKETVTFSEAPLRFESRYENEFSVNTQNNIFIEQGSNATLWKAAVTFRFKTLTMRIIGPFVKKRFTANTQRDMARFKTLVESL